MNPLHPVTAQEAAKAWGVSVSTARRRLEAKVAAGTATRRTTWEETRMPRATHGLPQPPAHRVIVYTVTA